MAKKRKLLLSAAVVDVELAKGVSSVQLVWPREVDGKLSVGKATLPVIAFEVHQVQEAQTLIEKLMEVANYTTNEDEAVVAISDQNILLVEADDKAEDVIEKRQSAGLKGGEVVG